MTMKIVMTVRDRWDRFDIALARARNGRRKFGYLLPLLTSRVLPSGAKARYYCSCVRSVMLYRSET